MPSGINGPNGPRQPGFFRRKIGGIKKAIGRLRKPKYKKCGRITLTHGPKFSYSDLLVDRNIPTPEVNRIRNWLAQGSKKQMPVEKLKELVPDIYLPRVMGKIKVIKVSDFKQSGLIDEGKTLALKLEDVLLKIQKYEEEERTRIRDEKRTLLWGDGVEDAVVSPGGTILSVDYEKGPGGDLFNFLALNLLPLDLDKNGNLKPVDETVDGGFYRKVTYEIGKKNVGKYAAEFRIAQEMAIRHKKYPDRYSEFPDRTFDAMQSAILGERLKEATPGYQLKLELRGAGSEYLYEFERDLKNKISEECRRYFKKLQKAAGRSEKTPAAPWESGEIFEEIAILTLGILSGKVGKKEALQYAEKRANPNAANYIAAIKNYLKFEEERMFSLREVINMISEIS